MSAPLFALAFLVTGLAPTEGPRLRGIAVNGSKNDAPLANAEVALRAGEEGLLQIIAETKTDRDGRFAFDKLPEKPGLFLVVGVNHGGIHYPAPRMQLQPGTPLPILKLTAYDAVETPNPLVLDTREIDLEIQEGALQVIETLWVNNPSLTTYVGQDQIGALPTTLSLSIPGGFERVTFQNEFNGRHFKLRDERLETDMPWTPGKREVKFSYILPIGDGKRALEWTANLPCTRCQVRVRGKNAEQFRCSLPRVAGDEQASVVFASSEPIVAGQIVKLDLQELPSPWTAYVRWSALAILAGLIAVTSGYRILRRIPAKTETSLPRANAA